MDRASELEEQHVARESSKETLVFRHALKAVWMLGYRTANQPFDERRALLRYRHHPGFQRRVRREARLLLELLESEEMKKLFTENDHT